MRLALLGIVAQLCACSLGTTQLGRPAATPAPPPAVFVIVLENHGPEVLRAAPYLASLASQYALASDYHAVARPSLPNYLAITSGDTWGIKDNDYHELPSTDIGHQLTSAHLPWRAYMESMNEGCKNSRPPYAVKHNPFAYYGGACPSNVMSMDRFQEDLTAGHAVFTWITPDLCHDMHDCDPATGDGWLANLVPEILASDLWRRDGVLFITFDEDAGSDGDNLVPLLVIAPKLRAHTTPMRYDHYSLLATIEDRLKLPRLGQARSAQAIDDLLP
jgi:hypothetical protein